MDLDHVKDLLDALDEEHQQHREDANQIFRARTAARLTYHEAQRIVATFDKDVAQVTDLLASLMKEPSNPKSETLIKRAQKALSKFKADREAAIKALDKYEDQLVGEDFQKAFEALRMALLDLDWKDHVDFDFSTKMHFYETPSWAEGIIRSGDLVIRIKYRAEDQYYWSEVAVGSYKDKGAEKTGQSFLARFVKETMAVVSRLGLTNGYIQGPTQGGASTAEGLASHFSKLLAKTLSTPALPLDFKVQKLVDESNIVNFELVLPETPFPSNDPLKVRNDLALLSDRITELRQTGVPFDFSGYSWRGSVFKTEGPVLAGFSFKNSQFIAHKDSFWSTWPLEYLPWAYLKSQYTVIKLAQKALQMSIIHSQEHYDRLVIAKDIKEALKLLQVFGGRKPPRDVNIQPFTLKISLVLLGQGKRGSQMHTAGAEDFAVFIKEPDSDDAWAKAKAKADEDSPIFDKFSYVIREDKALPIGVVRAQVDKDLQRFDKHTKKAWARPVSEDSVMSSEPVVVDVTARNEQQAIQKGTLMIKAKGRVPPKATISAGDIKVHQLKDGLFRVSGTRKVLMESKIIGWYFYGVSPIY